MKIVCAWCNKVLGYKCPHCGEPLQPDPTNKLRMICQQLLVRTYFTIDLMPRSDGICGECRDELRRTTSERERQRKLSEEDRANIAALDGAGNRGEPAKKGE